MRTNDVGSAMGASDPGRWLWWDVSIGRQMTMSIELKGW